MRVYPRMILGLGYVDHGRPIALEKVHHNCVITLVGVHIPVNQAYWNMEEVAWSDLD
ncbi:MAG TPA: hypothetical protein VFE96_01540 [Candidatus Bathyarchaeia archaeon]|jgi:hypothetical protein|nr:hypothetical protein [Candidatus Bathyarchaeia archaeon]